MRASLATLVFVAACVPRAPVPKSTPPASTAPSAGDACREEARRSIAALAAEVEAAQRARPPGGVLRASLDRVLELPCMHLAAENQRPLVIDDSEVFVDWWKRGGDAWVASLLEMREVVLPPDPRHRYPPGSIGRSLLCDDGDAACGSDTSAWLARADQRAVKEMQEEVAMNARRTPRDSGRVTAAGCAARVSTSPDEHRYTVWRNCLEQVALQQDVLPLGRLRAPASGWLAIAGRRGHDELCDQLALFDLASGAAYTIGSCAGLQLGTDGPAAIPSTPTLTVKRGQIPVEKLRELALGIFVFSSARHLVASAQRFPVPSMLVRAWVPKAAPPLPDPEPPIVRTSSQTKLRWAWIEQGKALGTGVVASALIKEAEAALVEGCPPVPLPKGLAAALPEVSVSSYEGGATMTAAQLLKKLGEPCAAPAK